MNEDSHNADDGKAYFDEMAAGARAGGASEQQVAILEHAADVGVLEIEDARSAAQAVVACLSQAGFEATYDAGSDDAGGAEPGYQVVTDPSRSQAEQDEILQACEDAEFTWVNRGFQMQPSAEADHAAFVNGKKDVLLACLVDAGVDADADASGYELARWAVTLPDHVGTDCLKQAGISHL